MKTARKQMVLDTINRSNRLRVWKQRWTLALLCLMAGMGAVLTSCSEDVDSPLADEFDNLVIEVSDETQAPLTRAAYAGLTTTFEVGDEIGIYAVNGATAEYSNIKYTLTETGWVAASKVPSKAAYTYYAYYPYKASPTTPNFAASGEEDAKFASMISGWTVASDQGNLNKFRANDLMLAKGTRSGKVVSFTMKHKMALAVVNSETVTFSYATAPTTKSNVAVSYAGMIPYFDGTNYYLFMTPDVLTTIGGQQLKAGAGKYITASGGELTEAYTLSYSTDGGSSFSSTRPSWLKGVEETRESDDEPVNFLCTVSGEKTTDIVKSTSSRTGTKVYESEVLKNAAAVSDRDLSLYKNDGTARGSRTTANCYLVHAPGTYKIPLVYGNAITNGSNNSLSYHATTTGSYIKTDLVRHDDNAITSPWIKDNGITVNGAELVWQDVKGLISNVGYSGDYLTFTVSADNIAPGNAVIAAKAGDVIVWSWHIWVTEETLSASSLTEINTGSHTNLSGNSAPYKVASCNIGSVPVYGSGTVTTTTYAGSTCIVKLTLTNGTAMTFTVGQPDCTVESGGGLPLYQCSPYYQWGRKDPLIPSNGTGNYNHDTWKIDGTQITSSANVTGANSIGTTIKHPISHYYNSSNYGPYNENKYNYWDINQNSNDVNIKTATRKTVYDPCPPDFCVPTGNLYYYMTSGGTQYYSSNTNARWDATNKAMVWQANGANLVFPASGYRSYSNGTLVNVGSDGYAWSASAYGGSSGRYLGFYSGYWRWNYYYRADGFPVRAVLEE